MAPQYQIVLSPQARADLKNIYAYTFESWGKTRAERYVNKIENAFNRLLDNPKLGRGRAEIKTGYCSLVIEKHVIFYKLSERDILILAVVHSRMDVINALKP